MEVTIIDLLPTPWAMARRKTTKQLTKAQRSFYVLVQANSEGYLDASEALSMVNRKLFRQGYCYGVESIEFEFSNVNPAVVDQVTVSAFVAQDDWVCNNAHVKGHALWNEMNQLVLDDNPSVKSKWHDFKVFLDSAHRAAYFSVGNLQPLDAALNPYLPGEWNYSDFVLPQHEVDPATGLPLPADQTQAHLIGPDVGVAPNFLSVGLINAYQESRSTVFLDSPNVPVGFGNSFFNLLTDSGSQEPELAQIIITENENPPYDLLNYPGGSVNCPLPVNADFATASNGSPNGILGPFVAPCGLIRIKVDSYFEGQVGPTLPVLMRVTMLPGKYKGIAAIPMGQ